MKVRYIKTFKRILIPIILTLVITTITAFTLQGVVTKRYEDLYIQNNLTLNDININFINNERNNVFIMRSTLESSMEATASLVLKGDHDLTDDFLSDLRESFGYSSVIYFNENGQILNYAILSGEIPENYFPVEGDAIYKFMNGNVDALFEEDRTSVLSGQNYYFYTLRNPDTGNFVQISRQSKTLEALRESTQDKFVVEYMMDDENVISVVLLNSDDLSVRDSSEGSDMTHALQTQDKYYRVINTKEIHSEIRFAYNYNQEVFEVISPVLENGEVIYIISALYSLKAYNLMAKQVIYVVIILSLVIIFTAFTLIYYSILLPLKELDNSILTFNPITAEYEKPSKDYFIYKETFAALENMSQHIKNTNLEFEDLHKEMYKRSVTDYLTKLPNRRHLIEMVNNYIKEEMAFSLIFIDLDNFKNINDTRGHIVGDIILKETAKRLVELSDENYFISRYGGDEFIILIKTREEEVVKNHLLKLFESFNKPIIVENQKYSINFSAGISRFPIDGFDSTELIRKADVGVYEAKEKGKNSFAYYDNELDNQLKEELEIREVLIDAIKNDKFKIVLQPQVDFRTNEIIAYEALARLKNSDYGPYSFIPVAEKFNLMTGISRIIFRLTIDALRQMRDNGFELKTIYMNFSPSQVWEDEITEYMYNYITKFDLDPSLVGIEITESVLLEKNDNTTRFFKKLKRYGFKVAIDDFGSGNSSINYLTNYSLELVKLDRSFQKLYLKEEKLDIYEAIVEIAIKLGYEVLAEGIETEEEVNLLAKTKLSKVQGYYFYKPMEVEEVIKLYKKNKGKVVLNEKD